jgi:hypothetical protein
LYIELYEHLYEGFANPEVLQNDKTVSYDDIKAKIIVYERASDIGILEKQREMLRIDLNENRENKLGRQECG